MSVPVRLPRHGSQRGQQERNPGVEIDALLRRPARGGGEAVGDVVLAQEVGYDGAGLPRCDGCVWVLEGGDAAVVWSGVVSVGGGGEAEWRGGENSM
jgi:hypothetical protein